MTSCRCGGLQLLESQRGGPFARPNMCPRGHTPGAQGDEGLHHQLRAQIMNYVHDHPDDFAPFIEDDEPFPSYVARMRKVRVWPASMVAARLLCVGGCARVSRREVGRAAEMTSALACLQPRTAQDGCWAGNIELVAASHLLQVNLSSEWGAPPIPSFAPPVHAPRVALAPRPHTAAACQRWLHQM